jgi:hypothetical protein
MQWEVFVVRQEGVLVPRWRRWQVPHVGAFVLLESHDTELTRVVRQARLLSERGQDVLPPLFDATVVAAKPDLWSVTGFERIETDSGGMTAFAQSWLMLPWSS